MVSGDVDIVRAKIPHHVEVAEEGLRAIALEGRQDLDGNAFLSARVAQYVDNVHVFLNDANQRTKLLKILYNPPVCRNQMWKDGEYELFSMLLRG